MICEAIINQGPQLLFLITTEAVHLYELTQFLLHIVVLVDKKLFFVVRSQLHLQVQKQVGLKVRYLNFLDGRCNVQNLFILSFLAVCILILEIVDLVGLVCLVVQLQHHHRVGKQLLLGR